MYSLLTEFKLKLLFYFSGVTENSQLERWVYETKELEEIISSQDTYLSLISLDYSNSKELSDLIKFIYFEVFNKDIYIDVAILTGWRILNSEITIEDGINTLDQLNDQTNLPIDFDGLASEINRVGLDFYKEEALGSVSELMSTLDKNKEMQTLFSKKWVKKKL